MLELKISAETADELAERLAGLAQFLAGQTKVVPVAVEVVAKPEPEAKKVSVKVETPKTEPVNVSVKEVTHEEVQTIAREIAKLHPDRVKPVQDIVKDITGEVKSVMEVSTSALPLVHDRLLALRATL